MYNYSATNFGNLLKRGEFMDDLDIFEAIELIGAFTLAILMAGGFSAY